MGGPLSELTVCHYQPGDEQAILDLFRQVFGQERSLEAWRWRYEGLPGATEHIILVKDGDGVLCGHYASSLFNVVYREREIKVALRLDFMVRPDLQRKGIGSLLIDECRKHLAERCSLHISFPNPNSTPITVKKGPHLMEEAPIYWMLVDAESIFRTLGWTSIPRFLTAWANSLLRACYRVLQLPALTGRAHDHEVVSSFSELLPHGADFRRRGCGIYFKRDAAFLSWRFDRNPEREYTVLYLKPAGGAAAETGYAALTVMEYQGFRLGFVVDILVDPPRFGTIRYLISRAVEWFRTQEVEAVTCMMTGNNAYTRALKSLGFVRIPNRFLPRTLNISIRVYDEKVDREYVCNLENWVITWADTDLV